MSRNLKIRALLFTSTCLAGVFVSLSAGIEWGTAECGFISFGTFVLAAMAAAIPL